MKKKRKKGERRIGCGRNASVKSERKMKNSFEP
jgi:hypothetical protein